MKSAIKTRIAAALLATAMGHADGQLGETPGPGPQGRLPNGAGEAHKVRAPRPFLRPQSASCGLGPRTVGLTGLPGGIYCTARFRNHAMILVTQSVFPTSAALASHGLVSRAEAQARL